jgi:hypothetical protein
MDRHLKQGMKGAEDNVVCNPNDKKPAGPIGAAEHKNAANDSQYPDKTNPDQLVSK